jgi:hypothetical protein
MMVSAAAGGKVASRLCMLKSTIQEEHENARRRKGDRHRSRERTLRHVGAHPNGCARRPAWWAPHGAEAPVPQYHSVVPPKGGSSGQVVQLNNTSAFSDKVKWRPPANLRCMIKGPLCAELNYPLQFRLHADQRRKAGQGVDRLR